MYTEQLLEEDISQNGLIRGAFSSNIYYVSLFWKRGCRRQRKAGKVWVRMLFYYLVKNFSQTIAFMRNMAHGKHLENSSYDLIMLLIVVENKLYRNQGSRVEHLYS